MHMVYRPVGNKYNKVLSSMAFKLDIPKGATIDNAIFTCTTAEATTIPPYDIYFRRSSPDDTLAFQQNCPYKDMSNLADQHTLWDFNVPNVEAGVEISSTAVKPLIKQFVQHNHYAPGVYFQLIILNTGVSKTVANTAAIKCVCNNDDMKKRPRLYIEWSV